MASERNWKKSPKRSVASIRAAWRRRGIFLHGTFMRERLESATFCAECVPKEVLRETGESWVETWVEGSHGWTSVPVCQGCKRSFSVFVDGEEEAALLASHSSERSEVASGACSTVDTSS